MVYTKAVVEAYSPKPFFFKDEEDFGTRYVAWTSGLAQLKQLVHAILKEFPEEIEILFKLQLDSEKDKFKRYHGYLSKTLLLEVIHEYELYIFSDGMHQLCVRRKDTGEYFAIDDHGILFIYSDSEDTVDLCLENGFENRNEKLFFEQPHWHYSPSDSDNIRDIVIEKLSLKAVE